MTDEHLQRNVLVCTALLCVSFNKPSLVAVLVAAGWPELAVAHDRGSSSCGEVADAKEEGRGRLRTEEARLVGWTHQTAQIGSGIRMGSPGLKTASGIGAGTGLQAAAGLQAAGKGLTAGTYRPDEAGANDGEGKDLALRPSLKSRRRGPAGDAEVEELSMEGLKELEAQRARERTGGRGPHCIVQFDV